MKQFRVVPVKPIVQVIENGEVLAEVSNPTLHYLASKGQSLPIPVDRYIQFDTMGDANSLDDLEGEDQAEVEQLIEDGFLKK